MFCISNHKKGSVILPFSDVSLRNERVVAVGRLCEVTAGILNSAEAAKLKQLILDSGVVSKVLFPKLQFLLMSCYGARLIAEPLMLVRHCGL